MKGFIALFLIVTTATLALPASAVVVADYQFGDTFSSSTPGASALFPLGGGSFIDTTVDATSVRAWSFQVGTGLEMDVSGLVGSSEYTVVMLFEAQEVSSYARLLATQDRTLDDGLYFGDYDLLFFEEATGTSDLISAGTYYQVVVTRDVADNYIGYVDGVQQFAFNDSGDLGIISGANRLIFFRDDGSSENTAGTVVRIRVFDNTLTSGEVAALDRLPAPAPAPAPATPVPTMSVWGLGILAGLLGLMGFVRRRKA